MTDPSSPSTAAQGAILLLALRRRAAPARCRGRGGGARRLPRGPCAGLAAGLRGEAEEGSAAGASVGLAGIPRAGPGSPRPPARRAPAQGIKREDEIVPFPTGRSNRSGATLFLRFHLLQLGRGGGAGGLPVILVEGLPVQRRSGCFVQNVLAAARPGQARRPPPEPCAARGLRALAGKRQQKLSKLGNVVGFAGAPALRERGQRGPATAAREPKPAACCPSAPSPPLRAEAAPLGAAAVPLPPGLGLIHRFTARASASAQPATRPSAVAAGLTGLLVYFPPSLG